MYNTNGGATVTLRGEGEWAGGGGGLGLERGLGANRVRTAYPIIIHLEHCRISS